MPYFGKHGVEARLRLDMSIENAHLFCFGCGHRYSDFLESAYLGCALCYQSFARPLEVAMEAYHGNTPGTKAFSLTYSPSENAKLRSQDLGAYVLDQGPLRIGTGEVSRRAENRVHSAKQRIGGHEPSHSNTDNRPSTTKTQEGTKAPDGSQSSTKAWTLAKNKQVNFTSESKNKKDAGSFDCKNPWQQNKDKTQRHSIVESVRLRLARNIHGLPYPNCLEPQQKQRLEKALFDRQNLFLFSSHLRGPLTHSVRITSQDEDHLRVSYIFPWRGEKQTAKQVLVHLQALEGIDTLYHWQFNSDYGFLTACPGLGGQGLRLSFQLHIPALLATQNWLLWQKNLNQAGYEVRNSKIRQKEAKQECHGPIQISNRHWSLNVDKQVEISRFIAILASLEQAEQQARTKNNTKKLRR